MADFDGDGKLDLASEAGVLLLGNGDGTFQNPIALGAEGPVAAADLNLDGKPDLAGGGVAILLNITSQSPVVTLSPTSLNFGNEGTHKESAPQYVTLTNTGRGSLIITSIASASSEYSVASNCPISPNPLLAGGSCTIAIRFKPSAVGERTGRILINDNAAGSPQSVGLTGNGVASHVTLSTTEVAFGVQPLGTTSKSMKLKLTNTGAGALHISGIAVSADFGLANIENQCSSSGSVPPKSSCNLAVTFSPTSAGTLYGTITITDSDPASPNVVGLSGVGSAVQLSSTKLKFGSVAVGASSKTKFVMMSNTGSTPLSITGINIGGTDPADFTQVNTCGSSLAAGAHCYITVTFTPTAKGSRTANIRIDDSDPTSPQMISLSGMGT